MRLDLFLKTARLIKRRTKAQEICGAGKVFVNGNEAKPAKEVKEGDVIILAFSSRILELRIRQIPASSKIVAPDALYTVTSEIRLPKEKDLWSENPLSS